jgi:hypothetical protein
VKMTAEHYTVLKERCEEFLPFVPDLRKRLASNPGVKNVELRLMWDVYHAAQIYKVYTYQQWNYTDKHIETAMKKIMAEGVAA